MAKKNESFEWTAVTENPTQQLYLSKYPPMAPTSDHFHIFSTYTAMETLPLLPMDW